MLKSINLRSLVPLIIVPILVFSMLSLTSCVNNSEEDPVPVPTVMTNTLEATVFSDFVDVGLPAGQSIGTIEATSEAGPITFSIVTQAPANALEVDAASGVLSVADPAAFAQRSTEPIVATLRLADAVDSLTFDATVTVVEIWTGPTLTFTKGNGTDPDLEENQDRITDNVWITRDNDGGRIYNALIDMGANNDNKGVVPSDTEWAAGTTADLEDLRFRPFDIAVSPRDRVGDNLVMHLITDDIYIDLRLTSWSSIRQTGTGNGGGFSYERSTPD